MHGWISGRKVQQGIGQCIDTFTGTISIAVCKVQEFKSGKDEVAPGETKRLATGEVHLPTCRARSSLCTRSSDLLGTWEKGP